MSGSGTKADQWVEQVLGIALPPPRPDDADETHPDDGFAARWEAARAAWQSAIETVDGQIGALQAVLRKEDNTDLRAIAETGLNAVTGHHKVKLMAAIMDVTRAGDEARPAACAKAQQMALEFSVHISTDARVAACDANPFSVPVAIAATLAPALAGLETILDAGARS